MVVKILGREDTLAYTTAVSVVKELGLTVANKHFVSDLAIAPLLTEKLSINEIAEPVLGTLIFHPSLLPYRRGASAIKHAYLSGDVITGVTWFWANDKLDGGDICEQEVVKIDYSLTPRQFYERHIIPALKRTLKRCLLDISSNYIRRIPQVESYATYDPKI